MLDLSPPPSNLPLRLDPPPAYAVVCSDGSLLVEWDWQTFVIVTPEWGVVYVAYPLREPEAEP